MFGKRLKEIRTQKGFSQCKLSKISGIPQSNIWLYENAGCQPTVFTIECLCGALGVTATELLGF